MLRRYEESGLSQRRFERSLGLKEWSLKGIFDPSAPRVPSLDNAKEICTALGLDLRIDPPRGATEPAPVILDGREFAQIPLHEASLAAGSGANNDQEAVIDHLAFSRTWLKRMGISAPNAVLARAVGESMAPTIHDGDLLLIDRARRDVQVRAKTTGTRRPPAIYALLVNGGARVKRIARPEPGVLVLASDNPSHAPEVLTGREVESLAIIGRVVWWGHTDRE